MLQNDLDIHIDMIILIWIVLVSIIKKRNILIHFDAKNIIMCLYCPKYAPIELLFNILKKRHSFYLGNLVLYQQQQKRKTSLKETKEWMA